MTKRSRIYFARKDKKWLIAFVRKAYEQTKNGVKLDYAEVPFSIKKLGTIK